MDQQFLKDYEQIKVRSTIGYGYGYCKPTDLWYYGASRFLAAWQERRQEELDFFWKAVNFSLVSKVIYNYDSKHYAICNEYLEWRFGVSDLFYRICWAPVFRQLEDLITNLPEDKAAWFMKQSEAGLDGYAEDFRSCLAFFECCSSLRSRDLMAAVLDKTYFQVEFFPAVNSFTKRYYEMLATKY